MWQRGRAIDRAAAKVIPSAVDASSMPSDEDQPYEPSYSGFDKERTKRAAQTAERAREGAAATGEMADATYVEDGPEEAARRMGSSEKEVGDSVERARRK